MRHIVITVYVTLAVVSVTRAERAAPWPKEKAWAWYNAQPWIRGCNFMSSDCANRIDQWQAEGFEERLASADRELALAESIGFNSVRLIIQFEVWLYDHDGFMERFNRYIATCAKHKISAMIVFANDCSVPKNMFKLKQLGKQMVDRGYHGGVKDSPHGAFADLPLEERVGYTVLDDHELSEKFYAMTEEIITKFKYDRRIILWDLFNEVGSAERGTISIPHLKRLFGIGWKIDPVQPLSACVWQYYARNNKNPAETLAGELSDVITYHSYHEFTFEITLLDELKRRYGRPLINTEWLQRIQHNTLFDLYPVFYLENVGNYCWGFVAGMYQTFEPWEGLWEAVEHGRGDDLDFTKWQHDLFRPSLRPYDPKEIGLIKQFNKLANERDSKKCMR